MLLQKLSFCMKDTYIIQGKDEFSLMKYNCGIPKPKMTDSKFTKFKYLILQVVRNQTIFIFKLFLFMATIFSVILK